MPQYSKLILTHPKPQRNSSSPSSQKHNQVQPSPNPTGSNYPSSLYDMIHHKFYTLPRIIIRGSIKDVVKRYGVSSSRRLLTRGLLLKNFDRVRDCLEHVLRLEPAEREVVLRLLRFWAYYGLVYPKAATVCAEPGCSRATFFRTLKKLEGLIQVINMYLIREHAQISNLYRLDRLLILIARYLMEKGVKINYNRNLGSLLLLPAASFYGWLFTPCPAAREGGT